MHHIRGVRRQGAFWLFRTRTPVTPLELLALARRADEKEKSMKKGNRTRKDELRSEYKLTDFPTPMVRGKYANRIKESSNVVVLTPEVAAVFPNEEAVNNALLSLIKLAKTITRPKTRSSRRSKTRAA